MPQKTQVLECQSFHFAGVSVSARKFFDRRGDALLKDEIYWVDNSRFGAWDVDNDYSHFFQAIVGW